MKIDFEIDGGEVGWGLLLIVVLFFAFVFMPQCEKMKQDDRAHEKEMMLLKGGGDDIRRNK